MVTGDPVSRSATASIPSTSMVVVGVGPSTTHTITVGVGLSPCKVTRNMIQDFVLCPVLPLHIPR